jgi:hypothetical protein
MKRFLILLCAFLLAFSFTGITYTEKKTEQDTVDHDLDQFDKDMRYAFVSSLMNDPEEYLHQTMRAGGVFYSFQNGQGKIHDALFISDTMGCCQKGLLVVLQDGQKRPANGAQTEAEGTLEYTCEEDHCEISLSKAVICDEP